jgi:hypothetical protein
MPPERRRLVECQRDSCRRSGSEPDGLLFEWFNQVVIEYEEATPAGPPAWPKPVAPAIMTSLFGDTERWLGRPAPSAGCARTG